MRWLQSSGYAVNWTIIVPIRFDEINLNMLGILEEGNREFNLSSDYYYQIESIILELINT